MGRGLAVLSAGAGWYDESAVTISPGAGTEGSAIWRFVRTCDRRRPASGDCRFRDRELEGDPVPKKK
jgi:hypothetical protein